MKMDPFAWISDHCHVSSSQKEMLNASPYHIPNLAPVSESEDDEEETVVVMMSVPDSSAEEEYRTPPERHSHSLTSSNEARMMEACEEDMEVNFGGCRDDVDIEEKIVDLSRDSEVFGCSTVEKMEEGGTDGKDLMMEDGRVPRALSDCCETTRDAEPVGEGNNVASANHEMMTTFNDAEINCCRNEGAANDTAEEVERVTCTYTLDNRSLNVRKLPSSICSSGEGVGAARDEVGICRVRNDIRDGGVERTSAEAEKGIGGGGDDGSGGKPSDAKEPNEEELTENILKVLRILAKARRPVYTEKVDIIGTAIKAGITFPRPSWWQEDSDNDSI